MSKIQAPPGGFRQSLFWDVDPSTIDPEEHARYIIERIFEFGNDEEVRWMSKTYSKSHLQDVLRASTVLSPKSHDFWAFILLIEQTASDIKKHWSVNGDAHNGSARAVARWKLENRINFGIGEKDISADILRDQWGSIDIDPWKRKALKLALE